jgi:hypothetical protein
LLLGLQLNFDLLTTTLQALGRVGLNGLLEGTLKLMLLNVLPRSVDRRYFA